MASSPFQSISALVSPVCSVNCRSTGYATRRSSISASSGPATAMSPRPSRNRLVSGSRSTRFSCSNVARIRETLLLCMPTRLAISVTPSRGSSAVKVRRTAMALTTTEAPLASVPPLVPAPLALVSEVFAGVMVETIFPYCRGWTPKAAPWCTAPLRLFRWLSLDDVVFRAERELGDVFHRVVLADHQDVVLAVAAGARQAVRHRDHGLHGNHHARLEDGVDVLAQLQAGFAAVVVAQDAEGVAVTEGAVGQQAVADVDLVELGGDVLADGAGLDQFQAALVHLDVDVPQLQRALVRLAQEEGPLQGGVVTGGHGEAVEREDVALLQLAGGGPVVGAVGVDAGLEPHPGVADLAVREGPGDLVHHGLGADEGHFVLGDAFADGVADGFAAQVADAGAVLDDFDFLGGLDHALAHGVLGDVQELGAGERGGDLFAGQAREKVVLDAQPGGLDASLAQGFLEAEVEVVAAPVGVDDVLAVGGAPRHAGVDVGGDGDGVVGGDHQGVVAAERGVQEVGVVLDAVVAGEDNRVQLLGGHDLAEAAKAALELCVGERELALGAVVQDLEALEFGDGGGVVGSDSHGWCLSSGCQLLLVQLVLVCVVRLVCVPGWVAGPWLVRGA